MLRRWLTVAMLLAVTLIALLSTRSVDPPVHAVQCEGRLCAVQPGALPAAADHDFPSHDPCLHDHACGGGAALGLGGLLLAVIAVHVLPTPARQSTVRRSWDPAAPPLALLVGGLERPPRLAR